MYNKVDLNGDKKPEVIAYAYGPMLEKDAKIEGVKILADEFVPNVGILLE